MTLMVMLALLPALAASLTLATPQVAEHAIVKRRVDDGLKELNLQHIIRVSNFSCGTPQQRLVAISEYHNVKPHELYTPHATVLHRCDADTGCCNSPEATCQPQQVEEVTLVHHVWDAVNKETYKISVKAVNHTKCTCSNFRVLPA